MVNYGGHESWARKCAHGKMPDDWCPDCEIADRDNQIKYLQSELTALRERAETAERERDDLKLDAKIAATKHFAATDGYKRNLAAMQTRALDAEAERDALAKAVWDVAWRAYQKHPSQTQGDSQDG